ncbi:MAG: DUF1553 domain-containing protein [Bryobacteraceae bacterium]
MVTWLLWLAWMMTVVPAASAAGPAPKPVDFNREVRPILSDTCFACHGPDEKHRMAGIRLDTREGAFAERKGPALIVPGNAAASRLIQRVSAEKKALRMPPPSFNKTLTEKQVATLKRWIDEGAKWDTHWSFAPPKRPVVPSVSHPKWIRNSIDAFVMSRLDREGLKPSAEADRAALLRRVHLDLTGLPPKPEEVDSFLADKTPDAYERRVEKLLTSPQHAERLAMHWLDLARYADTHGYHIDSHRDMWHWRDWVIDAFQQNMPYDRFTVEQIAGDLFDRPTRSQRLATGFHRNHMINFEGGAIPEEYQTEYVVDRVEVTSTVWMGLTMGCTRCHDHKYDPLSQRDFYRMFAFYNTVAEKGLDGRAGNAEPMLQLTTDEQEQRLAFIAQKVKENEEALEADAVSKAQKSWEQEAARSLPVPSHQGMSAHYELDNHLSDTSGGYAHGQAVRGDVTFGEGMIGKAAALSGETHAGFGDAGRINARKPFSLALWIKYSTVRETPLLQKLQDAKTRRGYELLMSETVTIPDLKRGAHAIFRLTHEWPENAIEIRSREMIVQGQWTHLAIVSDGSGKAGGLRLFVDGKAAALEITRDRLTGSIENTVALGSGDKSLGLPYKGQFDDIRVYGRTLDVGEPLILARDYPVRSILETIGKRSKDQNHRVRDYYLTHAAPRQWRDLYAETKALKAEKTQLDKTIPNTMVMAEMDKPRMTHVLGRGDYRNKGEVVTAGVPAALPPLPAGLPANRLGLAKWLVDPSNPLTARVAVNRFWQMYFGTGIVKTAEDFGSQGEPPSHPELLDWLATEFVRSGWDVRAIERLIVSSSTYRQSSKATPALIEKDPENRLLARGSRFRLQAEMVRDNALAIGGLLDPEVGGPSVYPYQPKGVWEDVAYGDVFSAQAYPVSTSHDLHRRSMYTFWKRTAPPASLATFDAPDREKCTARRSRTNTPLQALVLMNDPTYIESARSLAQRVIREAGRDPGKRVQLAYRVALARKPTSKELQTLRDLAEVETAEYRRNKDKALQLLSVGQSKSGASIEPSELAAWTTVASAILSLDETITRE